MKDKTRTLSADECESAYECLNAGLSSEQRRLVKGRSIVSSGAGAAIKLRLGYRPPLRFGELLAFFRDRALAGVELVDSESYARTVRIEIPGGLSLIHI